MRPERNMNAESAESRSLTRPGALRESERCLYCFRCALHLRVPGPHRCSRLYRDAPERQPRRCRLARQGCKSPCRHLRQDMPLGNLLPERVHEGEAGCARAHTRAPPVCNALGEQTGILPGKNPAHGEARRGARRRTRRSRMRFRARKARTRRRPVQRRPSGRRPRKSIPPFRLPGGDLARDTGSCSGSCTPRTRRLSTPRDIASIAASHDALFIAVGLGRDRTLGIPGEDLRNVYPVLEFLETAKKNPRSLTIGSRVVVVGGGNVSLDAAATARHLGAEEVTLLYRRSEEQMLVWRSELAEARRLGVRFRFLSIPLSIKGNLRVEGVLCRGMRLGRET